jgi:excisionase family DNA binding protein
MKTETSPDGIAVKIWGLHSPHPVIITTELMEKLGGPEPAFHRIKALEKDNCLPRFGEETHPLTLRDLSYAEENERLGYRHWLYAKHQGQHVRESTGYDMVWGYQQYDDEGRVVVVDAIDKPLFTIDLPDLLTTAQAARMLGMTDSGIRRAILEERLPAQKLSDRVILIKTEDVINYKKSTAGRPRKI